MSGNVYEWCSDAFRPFGAAPDEVVPGDNPRVVKGGCYLSAPCDLRVTHRDTMRTTLVPTTLAFD